jgi:hypothetical protein
LALLINGILDICVNNPSRGYGVFKLNFRDILNYFMLLITGIFVSKPQGIRDICTHSKQGRIQDFKLGGADLKKLRRAEGGAKMFRVFRVKNHDFTPKNRIFSNCGGRRENFWGISCEKSRFYVKKSYFFPILGGAHAGCAPPGSAPAK